jgi:hypothetical protein
MRQDCYRDDGNTLENAQSTLTANRWRISIRFLRVAISVPAETRSFQRGPNPGMFA